MKTKLSWIIAFVLVTSFVCAVDSRASILVLSELSSRPLVVDPSELSASAEFTVVGDQLTLTITNLTPGGTVGFDIQDIYFNAASNITGLIMDPSSGWTLNTKGQPPAGGTIGSNVFGVFDFGLREAEPDTVHEEIDGGTSRTFTFTILGSGTYADTDFSADLSEGSERTPAYISIGFWNRGGGSNDWAYGADVVPEPATIAILGLGGLLMLRTRRK